jgi:hypothetical protein
MRSVTDHLHLAIGMPEYRSEEHQHHKRKWKASRMDMYEFEQEIVGYKLHLKKRSSQSRIPQELKYKIPSSQKFRDILYTHFNNF